MTVHELPEALYTEYMTEAQAIKHVQKRIKEAMEAQGVNRTELAKRLGVTQPRVSQLLGEQGNLTVRSMAQVQRVLDVELLAKD